METIDSSSTQKTSAPIWNTVLLYGGYSSGASIILSLLFYLTGINLFSFSGMAISMLSMLALSFAFAALAMRHQRDKLDGGIISYGRALLVGFIVILIGSFVSGLWNYVLINLIDPGYIASLKEQFVNTWGDSMPQESMEQALEQFDRSSDIVYSLRTGIVNGGIFGLIISAIAAAFMKREPRMDYMK